jgi:hypothetical protein
MNAAEHLMTCLGEEGAEIAQDASKCNRFGVGDTNILQPTGPTNLTRLIKEVNELIAVMEMLVENGTIPKDWQDAAIQNTKRLKVITFMHYAHSKGTLDKIPENFANEAKRWTPIIG